MQVDQGVVTVLPNCAAKQLHQLCAEAFRRDAATSSKRVSVFNWRNIANHDGICAVGSKWYVAAMSDLDMSV